MNLLVLLASFLVLLSSEPTNFDYADNGDNWAAQGLGCDTKNEENKQQSPIEIIDEEIPISNQSYLFSNFYPADATLTFFNTTTYLRSSSFGEIYSKTINGNIVVMKATQIRFRSHSEHKIYGKYYDLEMQIFFTQSISTSNNERLGMSFLFEQADGSSNKVLKTIKEAYPNSGKIRLDLSEFISNSQPFDFWFYLGSITIPNCQDHGLEWIVSKKVLKMSKEERDFFWNLFNNDKIKGNYRKIQPIRGNKIDSYHFSSA